MISSRQKRYKITAYLRAGRNPKATARELPHEALANLADDVADGWQFYDRWGPLYSSESSLTTPEQRQSARAAGLPPPTLALDLRDHLRKAWRDNKHSLDFIERSAGLYTRFAWVFKGRQIELVPEDLWSTICILFLRDRAAGRTAICANPDCRSPFFIRPRKSQKYCVAGPCTKQAQREQKLDWWKRNYGAKGTEK